MKNPDTSKLRALTVLLEKKELVELYNTYPNFDDVPQFVEVTAWPKVTDSQKPHGNQRRSK